MVYTMTRGLLREGAVLTCARLWLLDKGVLWLLAVAALLTAKHCIWPWGLVPQSLLYPTVLAMAISLPLSVAWAALSTAAWVCLWQGQLAWPLLGYWFGFALLVGYLGQQRRAKHAGFCKLPCYHVLVALLWVYASAFLWLTGVVGLSAYAALSQGVWPFIGADVGMSLVVWAACRYSR